MVNEPKVKQEDPLDCLFPWQSNPANTNWRDVQRKNVANNVDGVKFFTGEFNTQKWPQISCEQNSCKVQKSSSPTWIWLEGTRSFLRNGCVVLVWRCAWKYINKRRRNDGLFLGHKGSETARSLHFKNTLDLRQNCLHICTHLCIAQMIVWK